MERSVRAAVVKGHGGAGVQVAVGRVKRNSHQTFCGCNDSSREGVSSGKHRFPTSHHLTQHEQPTTTSTSIASTTNDPTTSDRFRLSCECELRWELWRAQQSRGESTGSMTSITVVATRAKTSHQPTIPAPLPAPLPPPPP